MEERLEGLERLVQGRLTMEDFKSGPPKPQTISELYWKTKESDCGMAPKSPGPILIDGPPAAPVYSIPKKSLPEEAVISIQVSPSVEEVRKRRELDSILKVGREVREREESLRRSTRIAEKRKAIHALLPTPGMPISLQLHKKHKTDKTESGSLEDSDSGSGTELEIDPLLQ